LIEIELETTYEVQNFKFNKGVVYTGSLDALHAYRFGHLPYRSLNFKFETLPVASFQEEAQVNYTGESPPFTRIVEYKKLNPHVSHSNTTTIVKEFPKEFVIGENLPFYPIDLPENRELYLKYHYETVKKFPKLVPIGRLADYKYFNMDQVIARTMSVVSNIGHNLIP
jgi:UDP-galactopyranose mutase